MADRKRVLPGVWAVLALMIGWAVMYFVLTRAIPKDKRKPDPRYPEAERLAPLIGPEDDEKPAEGR